MKKILEKIQKRIIGGYRRYEAPKSLIVLTSHHHPKIKAIGGAILEALTRTFSEEEKLSIKQIEKRRSHLLHSKENIIVVDYGAGLNDSNRTIEEMKKGIESTESIVNICKASKSPLWASILFKIIRKLQPSSSVELGTCVGISTAYLSTALQMNGRGHLYSLEGAPEVAKIAQKTLDGLDLENSTILIGPFHNTFKGVLESAQPIDFFFNDGHHDHDAVIEYFNTSLPYLADETIIILDDISWSPGMRKAWTQIENHAEVKVSIDMETVGIILLDKKLTTKEKFRIPL